MKKTLCTAILFVASVISLPASAVVCDYTCNIQGLIQRISEVESNLSSQIQTLQETLAQVIRGVGEQISGAIEKQISANQQMTEGMLAYQAQNSAVKANAETEAMYGDESIPARICQTIDVGQRIGGAADDAGLNAKAITAAKVGRSLYNPSMAARTKEMYDAHFSEYCSSQDQARGRCTAQVAPTALQNADVIAATVLTPNSGETYSTQELRAAQRFITNATDPFPTEMLPPALERSNQGKAYILAQMAESAQLSVAQYSWSRLLANRTASSGLGAQAGADANISLIGLMKKFVEDRFTKPEWKTDIATKSDVGVLREIAIMLSFRNWLDYHTFLQNERMEALLATQLAIGAKDHNAPVLAAQRQAANTVIKPAGS